jgi:hypothetical protein
MFTAFHCEIRIFMSDLRTMQRIIQPVKIG